MSDSKIPLMPSQRLGQLALAILKIVNQIDHKVYFGDSNEQPRIVLRQALLTGPLPKIIECSVQPNAKSLIAAAHEILKLFDGRNDPRLSWSRPMLYAEVAAMGILVAADPDHIPAGLEILSKTNFHSAPPEITKRNARGWMNGAFRLADKDLAAALELTVSHRFGAPEFTSAVHACFARFVNMALTIENPPKELDKAITHAIFDYCDDVKRSRRRTPEQISAYQQRFVRKWGEYADRVAAIDSVRVIKMVSQVIYDLHYDDGDKSLHKMAVAIFEKYIDAAVAADIRLAMSIVHKAITTHFGSHIPRQLIGASLRHVDALTAIDAAEGRKTILETAMLANKKWSILVKSEDLSDLEEPTAAKWREVALATRDIDPTRNFFETTSLANNFMLSGAHSPLRQAALEIWPEITDSAAQADPNKIYHAIYGIEHTGIPQALWHQAGQKACQIESMPEFDQEKGKAARQNIHYRTIKHRYEGSARDAVAA